MITHGLERKGRVSRHPHAEAPVCWSRLALTVAETAGAAVTAIENVGAAVAALHSFIAKREHHENAPNWRKKLRN